MNLKCFIHIMAGCLTIFSLSACMPTFEPIRITGIPISLPDSPNATIGTILAQVNKQVEEYVPGAYASSLTFLGRYEDLDRVAGTINIGYVRVGPQSRYRSQVIVGMVSVNTFTQTMEMHFEDHSKHYSSDTPPPVLPENLSLFEVAILAHNHIDGLGLIDCDVTLTYLESTWLVVCTEPGSGALGARRCKFEIDSTTLEIQEPK